MSIIAPSPPALWLQDYIGNYQCSLTVDEAGVAGAYECALFARATRRLVQKAVSQPDGTVVFRNLAPSPVGGYFAVAFDHGSDPVNAAISDQLTLEPMP